ncbi:hypothetical protein HAX54_007954, partial [Datura stramonium]|nr:hypothetical protein [Datura stramonium]
MGNLPAKERRWQETSDEFWRTFKDRSHKRIDTSLRGNRPEAYSIKGAGRRHGDGGGGLIPLGYQLP